jgi:hypothetical protein
MLLSENLLSCIYWAPSLTRGRVCNLQCNHSLVRVAQNPKPYFTVSSETPPTWRARFPHLYPPGSGWPNYTSGTGFPLRRLLGLAGLRWRYSNPPPTWLWRCQYIFPNIPSRHGPLENTFHHCCVTCITKKYYNIPLFLPCYKRDCFGGSVVTAIVYRFIAKLSRSCLSSDVYVTLLSLLFNYAASIQTVFF